MFFVIENEAHLEPITGLLGTITTQEINYNSRAMQILQLQARAVIFNDVCEPAALFITNIHTQSYAHVLILFTIFLLLLRFFFLNHCQSAAIPFHFLKLGESV